MSSATNAEPITFIGSVKQITGTLFALSFKAEDAVKIANEKGWVNIDICFSKGKQKWYAKKSTFVPKPKSAPEQSQSQHAAQPTTQPANRDDDLPF